LPDETVLDGEVVALDEQGRPSFNLPQNHVSSKAPLAYFVFDLLMLNGRDVMGETLEQRRVLLERNILPKLGSRSAIRRNLKRLCRTSSAQPNPKVLRVSSPRIAGAVMNQTRGQAHGGR